MNIKTRCRNGNIELLVEDNHCWYLIWVFSQQQNCIVNRDLFNSVQTPLELKELDPEYNNSTIYIAAAFFYDHGGVGRSTPADLVNNKPTIPQLAEACIRARGKSIDAKLIEIMAKKVVEYHELDFDALKDQIAKYRNRFLNNL